MFEVITFLERLGRASRPMSDADYMQAAGGFPSDIRAALAARDGAQLARLLGGRPFMACSIAAPDYDEPLTDDQPVTPDDTPDEEQVRAA